MNIALVNMSDGTVQGHKAGCADLSRGTVKKQKQDEPWELEVDTKAEAWYAYNADFIAEGGPANAYEIDWAPCTKKLPEGDADELLVADARKVEDDEPHIEAKPSEELLAALEEEKVEGQDVKPEDELSYLRGLVAQLTEERDAALAALAAKQGKKTVSIDEETLPALAEMFSNQNTGIKITDDFVAAKQYARARGADSTGQGWTIYQYANGRTELVPLKAAGKAKEICERLVSELGRGDVKPSGYVVLAGVQA